VSRFAPNRESFARIFRFIPVFYAGFPALIAEFLLGLADLRE
jgi:hypothetical protein